MGQLIALVSGAGGTGKTVSAACLGLAFSQLHHKTAVVDLNAGLRCLDLVTGISDQTSGHWGDIIRNGERIDEILTVHPDDPSLSLLPAPPSVSPEDDMGEPFCALMKELKKRFDVVLLDGPSGADSNRLKAVSEADKIILTVQPYSASVRCADKVAGILAQAGHSNLCALVCRYRPDLVTNGSALHPEQIIDRLKLPLIGIIPEDAAVIRAAETGRSLFCCADSVSAVCYRNAAERLLGQDVPMSASVLPKPSFLSRFGRKSREQAENRMM